jgi:GNAT superfamily N-acetyltransferase
MQRLEMGNYTIRMATSQDEASLNTLLKASYPELMRTHYQPEILERALPLMTKANSSLLKSGTYYVAEVHDRAIVSCGGWTMERPGTGEIVEWLANLRHFATHPGFTGKGIGRAIYETSEKYAKRAGIDRLECYASLNAQPFYKALGFEPVEAIEVRLRCDLMFESMLMTRRI